MPRTRSRLSKNQVDTSSSLVNLALIGLLAFVLFQLVNRPPRYITQEPEVIVREVIKEVPVKSEEPYREDVYKPDLNRRIRTPPFNYPTRGPPEEYNMVGFLQDSDDPNKLQQLYGRRTYPNSNNWNYFVKSDQYHQIPIPVTVNGKNCTDENGCTELNNKDSINLLNKFILSLSFNSLQPLSSVQFVPSIDTGIGI